ncbi:hypothetical protein JL101_035905 (plasmid) [Skermanella rosea]|uniref:hypothetical protein n=1 Tax=Skermanella rosea TaxID=1817965 RepID=UPI001934A89D|nr:hypothetical protein [Skermanella rosea]UEM08038.1 hypothetical protein JL101_035905 [Skermanella rosea]
MNSIDWVNGLTGAFLGFIVTVILTYIINYFTSVLEFWPRRLECITIITTFIPFFANGRGDTYNDVLYIRIRNNDGNFIVIYRAVFLINDKKPLPMYENASISQKYPEGYEAKFGPQWWDLYAILPAYEEVTTYVPLSRTPEPGEFPAQQRGTLLIEYVHSGKTGVHRAPI